MLAIDLLLSALARRLLIALGTAALLLCAGAARAQEEVIVYAAASLTDSLQAIVKAGGFANLKFSFGSSSTLARQIEQGAPAQVFISADEPWMDHAQKSGRIEAGTRRNLASNRLAIVQAGAVEAVAAPLGEAAVRAALDPVLAVPNARIATGDPAHVPVGKYAQAALTSLGLWASVEPRLARADNVRAALVLVERGEAPAGIVYLTDALASPKVKTVALFPAHSHPPIRYPAALLKDATPTAQRFFEHLFSPAAQTILRSAGFGPG